jgi:rubredoxin
MKPMKCKICGKGFTPSDDSNEARGAALARLSKHRRKDHPNAKSTKKPKSEGKASYADLGSKAYCPHCGKRL